MFPNPEIQEIYKSYKVNRCYLYQNLTDTESTSMFFVFMCGLNSCIREDKAQNIIFKVMLKSKMFDRLDLSAEFYKQFNCRDKNLRKQVGFFEIENIDKPNVITVALNPEEYYERFSVHSDNKKHKGLKKLTPDMDFDSYSNRLSGLTEYCNEHLNKVSRIQQIEQSINESMQMKSISKVKFGQLNDKRLYFSNEIVSLPYGHPYLENLRKHKDKYRSIYKVVQSKKDKFLKEDSEVIENIPVLNILKQIFGQVPILYELNSHTKLILSGWKTTKEFIKNGS